MKVFVYGTLKQGYGNHRILEGKSFLGPAVTIGRFNMLNSGFPVLIPADDGLPVKGEVYDITGDLDTLDRLDQLEGEGVMYDRREIYVLLSDGERVVASVYVGNPTYWRRKKRHDNDQYLTDDNHLEWSRQ
jgi:gamma-glutamylaminecyclotransferase